MAETARKICKRLHAYLRLGSYAGKVLSVRDDVIRLDTAIGLVSVLTNARCLTPFSVVVHSTKPFPRYAAAEGQEVLLGDDRIEIPACGITVDLSQATDIDLSVETMRSVFLPVDLDIRMRHLLRVIESNDVNDSFAPLITGAKSNAYCDEVRPLLKPLFDAFRDANPEACRAAGGALANLSNGSTSTSDDLLCGYAAGYAGLSAALGRTFTRVLAILREMASGAAAHTTDPCAAFLLQAGEGLVSEDVYQMLQCIFSDAAYSVLVANATRIASVGVIGVNHLTGVYLAITTLLAR